VTKKMLVIFGLPAAMPHGMLVRLILMVGMALVMKYLQAIPLEEPSVFEVVRLRRVTQVVLFA
jgi:hypothetical protein